MKFEDKVVLIAGASGNLGEAVARKFGELGAYLALVDRSKDRLRATFSDLAAHPEHQLFECVDMTNADLVNETVRQVEEKAGRIDVFITVVGGFRAGTPLHETPIDMFDRMMDLNTRTFYLAAQAVIPGMLERGSGKIVAVGARPGLKGLKNMAAYSAAKSALIRLVESLSAELKERGVNVNCVLPGTMDTPQNRAANPNANSDCWVQLDSVADVIVFLGSEAARDVHGASIPVYGLS